MTTTEVAELVLKKCTVSNAKDRNVQSDSKDYTVTFNYEFIEDKDHAKVYVHLTSIVYYNYVAHNVCVCVCVCVCSGGKMM